MAQDIDMLGGVDFLSLSDQLGQTLSKERQQSNLQMQEFEQQQLQMLRDTTVETSKFADTVLTNTKSTQENLDAIVKDLDRVDEINNSLLLQIIEPVAGIFSSNYSREKLAKDAATKQNRIKVIDASTDNQKQQLIANQQVRESRLNEEQAKVIAETQDVESVRQEINDTITARNLQLREQSIALETLPLDQLQAKVQSGELTLPQLRQEQLRRTNQETAAASAALSLQGQQMNLHEANRQLYLQNMGLNEVENAIASAQKSASKNVAIGKLQFSLPELAAKRKEFIESATATAMDEAAAQVSNVGISSSVNMLLRTQGFNADDAVSPEAGLATLANDPNGNPIIRSQAAKAQQIFAMAARTQTDSATKKELFSRLDTTLQALNEQVTEKQLETVPKAQQPAYREYYQKQRIDELTNASTILAENIILNETATGSTGNRYYDSAIANLSITDENSLLVKQGGEEFKKLKTSLATSETPALDIVNVVQQPAIVNAIANNMMDQARLDLYEYVARKTGDKELEDVINDPNNPASRSEKGIYDWLKARKAGNPQAPSVTDIARQIRENSYSFAKQAFKATGSNAVTSAALNKVLFNNHIESQFSNSVIKNQINALSDTARKPAVNINAAGPIIPKYNPLGDLF